MSIKNKLRYVGNIGTMALADSVTVESGGVAQVSESIPAAKTGTLTTRTDNDTGTLTMSSGHGITTGAKIDIYWTGGRRYNVTVGTVSTNSVPFDLGSGDNLPTNNTAVTVMVQQVYAISTGTKDGDLFSMRLAARGRIEFRQSDNTAEFAGDLTAGKLEVYDNTSLFPPNSPPDFTVITKVAVTHADSAAAAQLDIAVAYDAGP